MKVIFRKIYNEHNKLRDDVIEGECTRWPDVGNIFELVGPPRDSGDLRYVATSPVTKYLFVNEDISFVIFQTDAGSIYAAEKNED